MAIADIYFQIKEPIRIRPYPAEKVKELIKYNMVLIEIIKSLIYYFAL
jgi:hypothetical protein